jgi:hypothetical protein
MMKSFSAGLIFLLSALTMTSTTHAETVPAYWAGEPCGRLGLVRECAGVGWVLEVALCRLKRMGRR